jgi:predicted dehydrogenase
MKILMVGLGSIGQRHLRNLRRILGRDAEIAAYRVLRQSVVLTDKMQVEQGGNLEEKYNLTLFDDMDAALDWRPDFVCICNPNNLHMPVALAAARAGCHLFVEKPLSHNYDQVEELISIVDQKQLVGFVTYQMRFHPCLQRLLALLQQNAIGKVLAVRAEMGEYMPGWHPWEDYRQSYAARKEMGGGSLLAQIHEMDYLYWLFGLPSRLYAVGGHLSSLEIDVEDVASVLMDCGGIPVHLHLDYVQRPPSRTLQVIGDAGKILIDLRASTLHHFGGDGALLDALSFEGFERNQMFIDELKHFLNCIDGKEKTLISLRDGAQSLRMALAAKESIASGTVVELI